MVFASTRDERRTTGLRDAIFRALAPDGGLYHPASEPDIRAEILALTEESSFPEIAATVLHALSPEEFSADYARDLCERAFPFGPRLVQLSEEQYILELFHGPSCAFKDFGACFLAELMQDILSGTDQHAVILTATSGDTGSAVAHAFFGKENIDVVILYPSGRVSPLQEKQLTTHGGNVHALEVDGSFDECQRMVKEAFVDQELVEAVNLTSANSINLGRLIPQSFYYIHGFSRMKREAPGEFFYCVPSGNFGNLTAGVLAWKWGLPVTGFIAATNANDVVPEYLKTGVFRPRPSVQTASNAMDVGNPSNFERLEKVFGYDYMDMRAMVTGESVTDHQTMTTMRRYYERNGILLDPHTATGVCAAQRFAAQQTPSVGRVVTLGTAHPGKFAELVQEATGVEPELPDRLKEVLDKEKRAQQIDSSTEALRDYLMSRFA
jgi:threonine synthase